MIEVDRLIVGGSLLLMDEADTVVPGGAVAVEGERIAAAGPAAEILERFRGRERIDAPRSLILPGLVNAHTHAAMTCFRGIADDMELMAWLHRYIFPAEAKNVDPELVYWGSMLACAEMIRSGTTAFCDMYLFEEETARAAKEAGMRCLVGEVLFDFPSPKAKTPVEGLAHTRRLLEKWDGDPLIRVLVEPHALYTCSPSLLRDARALADEFGATFALHLLENRAEREQLREKFGRSAIEFLDGAGLLDDRLLAFHCVCLEEKEIRLMADRGCRVAHCPESNMKLASGAAPAAAMIEAGIRVGLGTDGCASNNDLDLFREMDSAAKLAKVAALDPTAMSARMALRMATCEGARALGLEGVGALLPGYKADLSIIGLDKPHLTPLYSAYSHLVYAVNGADVDTVLIGGRVVMRDRRLLTIDEGEAMRRVGEIARRIRASLDL